MEKKINLIWDFWGPEAELTAKHHEIHLKQFAAANKISPGTTGYDKIGDAHFAAYIVVTESEMKPVRDALKPQRGTLNTESE